MQVLLVEDDDSLAEGLRRGLRNAGFNVNRVARGGEALSAIAADPPDLMILDLGLPDIDGLDVLRRIRNDRHTFPVLVLTARDSLEDKVSGLDLGADDYLAKPFELAELEARLRVLGRRMSVAATSQIELGEMCLDLGSHCLTVAGNRVDLSHREFALLQALLENPQRVHTRSQLESRLYAWGEEVASNSIEVHIHNLRRKLPDGLIKTVRGVGYTVQHQAA